MSVEHVLAWLATYAVHSTLLGALAWLVARGTRSARVREIAWRTALFGALATASAQVSLELVPSSGHWRLAEIGLATVERPAAGADAPVALTAPPAGTVARGAPVDWTAWALRGWLLAVLGSVALTAGACALWRGRLAGRRRLTDGALVRRTAELTARSGAPRRVRLSVAAGLEAPIAIGILRPEVCLPPRALSLPPRLRDAMLAHELAHLARRDPLWLALARGVETLFLFQPLHRLARRRLAQCAEELCDDRALEQTGDRVSLARCLAEVAGWVVGGSRLRACAMADRRSALGTRVERILDEARHPERARRAPVWLGIAVLATTVQVAPGFARPAVERRPGPSAAHPAVPPSLEAILGGVLAELSREMDLLEEAVEEITVAAGRRRVDPGALARLERVEVGLRALRAKERWIGELLARWRADAAPEDER